MQHEEPTDEPAQQSAEVKSMLVFDFMKAAIARPGLEHTSYEEEASDALKLALACERAFSRWLAEA